MAGSGSACSAEFRNSQPAAGHRRHWFVQAHDGHTWCVISRHQATSLHWAAGMFGVVSCAAPLGLNSDLATRRGTVGGSAVPAQVSQPLAVVACYCSSTRRNVRAHMFATPCGASIGMRQALSQQARQPPRSHVSADMQLIPGYNVEEAADMAARHPAASCGMSRDWYGMQSERSSTSHRPPRRPHRASFSPPCSMYCANVIRCVLDIQRGRSGFRDFSSWINRSRTIAAPGRRNHST